MAAFKAAFDNVVSGVYTSPPEGFVVGASGWALDEINGAKVFLALSGWESIEKRLAAHGAISERFAEVQKFTNVVEVVCSLPLRDYLMCVCVSASLPH